MEIVGKQNKNTSESRKRACRLSAEIESQRVINRDREREERKTERHCH